MYKGKKICVVVPAYNEEKFIGQVILSIPEYVDRIFVIDDASTDSTLKIASSAASKNIKVSVFSFETNRGVGGAITAGHELALKEEFDIIAVMAGDNQMDPLLLPRFIDPLVSGEADYAKGDRMSNFSNRRQMPAFRQFGNVVLTFLTRIASGYRHVNDPQNGFTAITNETLSKLPLRRIYKGFAFENDMLIHLNMIGARIIDISHPAVYTGQVSKIKYPVFIIKTSWMLLARWIWRFRAKRTS